MKLVIQRVKEASVEVNKNVVGQIDKGLLIFFFFLHTDNKEIADYLFKNVCNLCLF